MGNHQKILVVEDEEHLAVGIKFNLEAEGYTVRVVSDGATALDVVNEDDANIDLIILDLMLPGMSGYAVCESLRAAGHLMPILILSARTLPEDRSRGFDVGADQYLSKPFELDELLSRAKNLLARYRRGPAANGSKETTHTYTFGDARIDFDTHEVRVDGKEVHVTPLELRLLEYFTHNEGRVIPRGELLEKVWGMPAHLKTRAPDQFIRRLRKTFEPKPNQPQHFLTIRDAGYRFVANP
jgi:two-component system OmpR family response regulator